MLKKVISRNKFVFVKLDNFLCLKSGVKHENLLKTLLLNWLYMFCESLSEYISYNTSIKKLDISSNQIDESNAATLKGSLVANENIV